MWENATDVMHLSVIHKPGLWYGSDVDKLDLDHSAGEHIWKATWKPADPPNNHVGIMNVYEHCRVWGIKMPLTTITVNIHQVSAVSAKSNALIFF